MKKFLQKMLGDKSGASAAEYALIIAVFGAAVVAGMTALGGSFQSGMNSAAAEMDMATQSK